MKRSVVHYIVALMTASLSLALVAVVRSAQPLQTPGRTLTTEVVLNDWVDFSALGIYRVQVQFIGDVRTAKNVAIEVQRLPPSLSVQVVPANPQELETLPNDSLARFSPPLLNPQSSPCGSWNI